MATKVEAESVLAVDVGAVMTRAAYFDTVDGLYRLIAIGTSTTTLGPPLYDGSEGIRRAIREVQEITGRPFFDNDEQLITPSSPEGYGIDVVAASLSAGAPIKVITMGLLDDISMRSAERLVETVYSLRLDSFSMNDRRRLENRSDAFIRKQPELVVVAGGTENGASKSVAKLIESVGLACMLQPRELRPYILYAGNSQMAGEIDSALSKQTAVMVAPNIRPGLDAEQLGPAQHSLREVFRSIHTGRDAGLRELDDWSNGSLFPTTMGFSRVIRFLSQVYTSQKGVLGVDIGASSTTIAAAHAGSLEHVVFPQLGLGVPSSNLIRESSLARIARWIPKSIQENELRTYIFDKTVYPGSLPVTKEEMYIEQALAREILKVAVQKMQPRFPSQIDFTRPDLLPWFEPIVASGSVLANAPTYGQAMLVILDGLEPTGVTTVVLDQSNLLGSLGVAAGAAPYLSVQALEAGLLVNLGTVIAPVANARSGTPVLRLRITFESGREKTLDVNQGSIEVVPLPPGRSATLRLQPLNRSDVGMGGPGRAGVLRGVAGSELGIVIDARGRPLQIPTNASERQQVLLKWRAAFSR